MDVVAALIEVLKTGGPYAMAAIFISGWWLERSDRQEKEIYLLTLYERTVTLAVETKVTVEKMQCAVTALTEAIHSMSGRLR